MAVTLTGAYRISQQGAHTILELTVFRGGGAFSGSGCVISSAKMSAIEAALITAGGSALSESGFIPGSAIAVTDGAARYVGSATWDRSTGEVFIDTFGFNATGTVDLSARFALLN